LASRNFHAIGSEVEAVFGMGYALRIIRHRARPSRNGSRSRWASLCDRPRRERQGRCAPTTYGTNISCSEVSNERIQIGAAELLKAGHATPAIPDRSLYLILSQPIGDSREGRYSTWLAGAIDAVAHGTVLGVNLRAF